MKAKRIVIILAMVIMLTGQVMATSWLPNIYTIKEDIVDLGVAPKNVIDNPIKDDIETEQTCTGEKQFRNELKEINMIPLFVDVLDIIGDGYHVISFMEEFYGSNEYTIFIDNNEIKWMKQGECHQEDYEKYSINADMNDVRKTFSDPDVNVFIEGYELMKQIDGISAYQKIQIISAAVINDVEDVEEMIVNETI